MSIGNEEEAGKAISLWRQEPPRAQLRNLQKAIESLELGQMYYDQKDNEQGVKRLGRCIQLLLERKAELERDIAQA